VIELFSAGRGDDLAPTVAMLFVAMTLGARVIGFLHRCRRASGSDRLLAFRTGESRSRSHAAATADEEAPEAIRTPEPSRVSFTRPTAISQGMPGSELPNRRGSDGDSIRALQRSESVQAASEALITNLSECLAASAGAFERDRGRLVAVGDRATLSSNESISRATSPV